MLDTCVVIDLQHLDPGVLAETDVLVSAVTLAELAYGLDTADPVKRYQRTERYTTVLEEMEVVPFGIEEAKLYGAMAALVRRNGRNPRPRRMDLQIAATAAAYRLPLLTMNPADFTDVDRLVEVVAV